ncbi:MAG: DUF1292 domain-containing protein [Thermacetogeniaceae bacterium]
MEFEREETIILTDEEGKEHEFNLIDVITVDGEEYAILQPVDEDDAIILRFDVDENGEEILCDIEDDEEWEKVADAWQEMQEEERN